jgi:hypothetical protein
MVKDSVTIKEMVDFLNELLEYDSYAISALFSTRIMCNRHLAGHESVQVGQLGKDAFQVGMVGVLNGLFGSDEYGWGHFGVNYDDGKIIEFVLLTNADVKSFIEPDDAPGDVGC